jgi:Holliday junction resolvase-like predicted endonuclease
MPKTLLEVFTESKKKNRRAVNRAARSKGSKAEALLLRQLVEQGYEVRRTHLSAYPDIIAWNENEILFIEVKARSNVKGSVTGALSLFRNSARLVTKWHKSARVLCYLRVNDTWIAYECINGDTIPVESIVNEER